MSGLFLLCVAGLLDRVRGGYPEGRPTWIAHVATSLAYTAMLAPYVPGWWVLSGLLLGEAAWRHDAGWRGDWTRGEGQWWQPVRWGALWAAPSLLLAYWFPAVLILVAAAPVGALLAALIAVRLPAVPRVLDLRHAGVWSELITLPIVGALGLAVKVFI